jgi:hypothetical protein
MRRQTHWENAREQGLTVGANITGKKRQRYEQIPYFWTEMFELKFDFIGDFNVPATRVQLTGSYAKGRFALRCFQGEKLRGIVLATTVRTTPISQDRAARSGNRGVALADAPAGGRKIAVRYSR